MRFKKVLLVFPEYKGTHFGANHPPVGLGYLSEILKQKNIEHDVVDMRLGYTAEKLKLKIRQFKPELVGISMMTLLHKSAYGLIEDIKKTFPDISIAAGGPHVSTLREEVLMQCPSVDFGIVREGELSLVELCEGVNFTDIKGFLFRQTGKIIYTGERQFVSELDSLPYPRYEKFEIDKYITDEIPVLTSRGCPYKCIYCPVKTAIGRKFRVRSAKNVADEIQYWHKKGKRYFGIVDDNFMMLKERVFDLCKEIETRGLKNSEFRCPNGIRADQCDKEVLTAMKKAGFKYIAIGVEAGNDKILQKICKGETIEVIKKAIETACGLGYDVILFFLVGSPGETFRDIEDSVRLAETYPVFDAKFYNLIPFPDTELFSWVKENNYFVRQPDDYLNDASHWDSAPVFATPELTFEERVEALKYTAKIRKKIRMKAMQRKLKKLKVFSHIFAGIFALDFVQDKLLHSRFLRRLGMFFFRKTEN